MSATASTLRTFSRPRGEWLRAVRRFVRTQPLGAFGAVVLLTMIVVAITAPVIAPENPLRISVPLRLQPPSWSAPLGRDGFGRDVLSRIIYGAQVSMGIGFSTLALSTVLKVTVGLISAYRMGLTDLILQRFVDGMGALPQLLILATAAAMLPRGPVTLVLLLGGLTGLRGSRVVRSAVIAIRNNDYLVAARALGASESRILLRHVLPNIFAPLMVVSTVSLGGIITAEASLSFLGLGLQSPTVSWGQMLSLNGLSQMFDAPWIALAPGIAISLAVYSINMLGDAMRDVLDPRLRGG